MKRGRGKGHCRPSLTTALSKAKECLLRSRYYNEGEPIQGKVHIMTDDMETFRRAFSCYVRAYNAIGLKLKDNTKREEMNKKSIENNFEMDLNFIQNITTLRL